MMLRYLWIALMALAYSGCTGPYSNATVKATDAPRVPSVRVRRVEFSHIPEIISATGELLAEDQATLRAKVAGRVAKLNVDLGSRVNEGDVIGVLEQEDYEFHVKQAEA